MVQDLNAHELMKVSISLEEWNIFERRWVVFQTGSGIADVSASAQLFQCATDSLGDALLKVDPGITGCPLTKVLAKMKALAVILLLWVLLDQNCLISNKKGMIHFENLLHVHVEKAKLVVL